MFLLTKCYCESKMLLYGLILDENNVNFFLDLCNSCRIEDNKSTFINWFTYFIILEISAAEFSILFYFLSFLENVIKMIHDTYETCNNNCATLVMYICNFEDVPLGLGN